MINFCVFRTGLDHSLRPGTGSQRKGKETEGMSGIMPPSPIVLSNAGLHCEPFIIIVIALLGAMYFRDLPSVLILSDKKMICLSM